MHQTNSGKSPKFVFSPTFIFCSPICPNNWSVVLWWKYILVFEKWSFCSTAQICKFSSWSTTRVIFTMKICIFERSYENLFDGCWHPLLSVLQCASTTLANSKYSLGYWWSHRILKSTVSMAFEHFVTCFVKHDEFLILNLSMLSQVEIKSRKRWASG